MISPEKQSPITQTLFDFLLQHTSTAAAVFPLNPQNRPQSFTHTNPAACRLLQKSFSELREHGLLDVVDPEHRQAVQSALDRLTTSAQGPNTVTVPVHLCVADDTVSIARKTTVRLKICLQEDATGQPSQRLCLVLFCPQTENEALAVFSRAAARLVEMSPTDDFFAPITRTLHSLLGDCIVWVAACHNDETLNLMHIEGLGKSTTRVSEVLGGRLTDFGVRIDAAHRPALLEGTLNEVPGGLHEVLFGRVPKMVCNTLERILGVKKIYGMGLARRGKIYGSVLVALQREKTLENREIIEAFGHLASLALHRRQTALSQRQTQSSHTETDPTSRVQTTTTTPTAAATLTRHGRKPTILIVEDQPALRELERHALAALGYNVLVADCAEQAQELFSAHAELVDLLLTDLTLPGQSGLVLARDLQKQRLDLPVLIVSGHSLDAIAEEERHVQGLSLLHKPFTIPTLEEAVVRALK
jgi:CheY-like chemotaxis protein